MYRLGDVSMVYGVYWVCVSGGHGQPRKVVALAAVLRAPRVVAGLSSGPQGSQRTLVLPGQVRDQEHRDSGCSVLGFRCLSQGSS